MRTVARILAASICGFPGAASAGVAGCPDCNVHVALSKEQANCIVKRSESLMHRRSEPLFFDASACGYAAGTMTATDPVIVVPPAAPKPVAMWLLLTKRQFSCLKKMLGSLSSDQAVPIKVELDDATCPPPS